MTSTDEAMQRIVKMLDFGDGAGWMDKSIRDEWSTALVDARLIAERLSKLEAVAEALLQYEMDSGDDYVRESAWAEVHAALRDFKALSTPQSSDTEVGK